MKRSLHRILQKLAKSSLHDILKQSTENNTNPESALTMFRQVNLTIKKKKKKKKKEEAHYTITTNTETEKLQIKLKKFSAESEKNICSLLEFAGS